MSRKLDRKARARNVARRWEIVTEENFVREQKAVRENSFGGRLCLPIVFMGRVWCWNRRVGGRPNGGTGRYVLNDISPSRCRRQFPETKARLRKKKSRRQEVLRRYGIEDDGG